MAEADYRRVTYDIAVAVAGTLVKKNPGMTFIFVLLRARCWRPATSTTWWSDATAHGSSNDTICAPSNTTRKTVPFARGGSVLPVAPNTSARIAPP